MVGNSGCRRTILLPSLLRKMMALRPEGLQFGSPRQVQPVAGFAQAGSFR